MFTVLDIVPPERRSLFGRVVCALPDALRGRRVWVTEAHAGEVRYFIIHAQTRRGAPDWRKICRAAGREASRLLMPRGVTPPPTVPAAAYDCSEYLRRVFCSTVFSVVRRLWRLPEKNVITLCDPAARCGSMALGMVKYARLVRVITQDAGRYAVFCERAMERYGAGMIVSEGTEISAQSSIVAAPFGLGGMGECPPGALVFDMEGERGYTVTEECIRLPARYTSGLPRGISEADLAAALFERARRSDAGGYVPRFLVRGGEKISLYALLDAADGGLRREGESAPAG